MEWGHLYRIQADATEWVEEVEVTEALSGAEADQLPLTRFLYKFMIIIYNFSSSGSEI